MPGYDPEKNKPGRRPGDTSIRKLIPKLKNDEILSAKVEMLSMLQSGEVATLADAARKLGINPARVYAWIGGDPDFRELIHVAEEILADDLIKELGTHANFIPKMMILKGLDNRFRDNYKPVSNDSKALDILEELRKIARENRSIQELETRVISVETDGLPKVLETQGTKL